MSRQEYAMELVSIMLSAGTKPGEIIMAGDLRRRFEQRHIADHAMKVGEVFVEALEYAEGKGWLRSLPDSSAIRLEIASLTD